MLKFTVIMLFGFAFGYSPGSENTQIYLDQLKNKNVGLVVNHSSKAFSKHLVDYLLEQDIQIKKLFALEHGIRGQLDAGEVVDSTIDEKTGLPIISLYGKNKAPSGLDVKDLDTIIFDIQDIGVRFFTYISSLYYVLQACADHNKTCIVMDRANPNVNNISGPVLDMKLKSFVGMFPIPILYGLTIGELAGMMVEEGWVKGKPNLIISKIRNWRRSDKFELQIKPSPNLPNKQSLKLYPSLALFEATNMSIGRGTYEPFQKIGHPNLKKWYDYSFKPVSIIGMSKKPKHQDQICYGVDLSMENGDRFTLKYIDQFRRYFYPKSFFKYPKFFNKLLGKDDVINRLNRKEAYQNIEKSWEEGIEKYLLLRSKYLIY